MMDGGASEIDVFARECVGSVIRMGVGDHGRRESSLW
jgi:hypothetical protein